MDFVIRRARPEDGEGLARLYLQFWEPHRDVDPLIELKGKATYRSHLAFARRDIRNKDNLIFVAISGDRVVGYIEALVKKNDRCFKINRYGWLNSAVTHKDYRRRGIAKALTEKVFEAFEARGIEHVKATVYNSNRIAMRTWRRLGLKPLSTNFIYIVRCKNK